MKTKRCQKKALPDNVASAHLSDTYTLVYFLPSNDVFIWTNRDMFLV